MASGTSPSLGAARPSADLAPGTAVGDYCIERKIGRGGMGGVYEAIQPLIGKRVALKVLHHELCADQAALTRFVQEARAVNRIGHSNIVDVFGFGTTADGRAFLAMELLEGVTLGHRMQVGQPISREDACDILVVVTHALDAAHQAGIVHRDLKPDNIFLTSGRAGATVKLLDFGIAKLTALGGFDEPVDCTQPGTLVGTPQYMAPEQARGQQLDGSADVYALGVVAFELLVGRPPFTSRDPVELLAKHITLRPPAPTELKPSLPALADELIGAMLEKEPTQRPHLSIVREQLLALRTAKASATAGALARARLQATEAFDAVDDAPEPRRRWWPLALASLVVAAGVLIASTLRHRDPTASPASIAPATPAPPPASTTPAPPPTPPTPIPAPAATPEPTTIVDVPASNAPAPSQRTKHSKASRKTAKKPAVKPADRPTDPSVRAPEIKQPPPPPDEDALRSPFERKQR